MKTLDLTKPIQTRCGEVVRILCTDAGGDMPVVGLMNGRPDTWTADGRNFADESRKSDHDLVNVPDRKSRFLNVYSCSNYSYHDHHRAVRNFDADLGVMVEVISEDGKVVEVNVL